MPCLVENLESSDIIAICAVVIAVMSMIATAYQAWVARMHARISVRPHVDFITRTLVKEPLAIELHNRGIGPALIQSITLKFDGGEYDVTAGLPQFLLEKFSALPYYSQQSTHMPGTPIGVTQNFALIAFFPALGDAAQHTNARDLIKQFEFFVTYKCLYGQVFRGSSNT